MQNVVSRVERGIHREVDPVHPDPDPGSPGALVGNRVGHRDLGSGLRRFRGDLEARHYEVWLAIGDMRLGLTPVVEQADGFPHLAGVDGFGEIITAAGALAGLHGPVPDVREHVYEERAVHAGRHGDLGRRRIALAVAETARIVVHEATKEVGRAGAEG